MHTRPTPGQTLEHLKSQAKHWLKALRANNDEARARLDRAVPDAPAMPRLRDVQLALARELGYSGWKDIKLAIAAGPPPAGSRESLVNRFLEAACPDHHVRGLPDHDRARHTAMRLLARHSEIAEFNFATAVVCGNVMNVEQMLAANPALANQKIGSQAPWRALAGDSGDLFHDLGGKGWEPLLYLCFTRLPLASANDHAVELARLLLAHGADPTVNFAAGGSRYTPLVGVIGEGEESRPPHPRRDELVPLLLDAGADPYDNQVMYNMGFKADYLWYLPQAYARSLQLGRQSDWNDPEWSMLGMGGYGSGARWHLHHAIKRGDAALARWCLEHGAGPNAPPAQDPRLPKHSLYEEAVRSGQSEIAELLVRHGAERVEVALNEIDAFIAACFRLDLAGARRALEAHPRFLEDPEPLLEAARRDRADVVAFMLDLGMSPDVQNDDHLRPLHEAASWNALSVARLLIARGAEVDAVEGSYGNTPLGGAVYYQHGEMIDLLSAHSRDVWELTYLGKIDRLRELLAQSPERARINAGGHTPLMYLPPQDESLALDVARLLVTHGADPSVRMKDGQTAADRALALGMFEVAAYLTPSPG
jgi:uncharacterized protein